MSSSGFPVFIESGPQEYSLGRLDSSPSAAYIQAMTETETKPKLTILLAQPRGFCAGVERAIEIVEKALEKFGAPVYVRHEIVHNKHVLEDLRAKGAIFVKELDEVPEDAPVIFSAHGVPKSVPAEAQRRNMIFIDATCPLVSKVHREAELHHRNGHHILLIGHAGHPEVIGTMGQLPKGSVTLVESIEDVELLMIKPDEPLAYVTQTTLSVDDTAGIVSALQEKFPQIAAPKKEDICYATTNRQLAIKDIAPRADVVIVVGSKNSSNSNRLVEVAKAYGAKKALLADHPEDIEWSALVGSMQTMGLTAGASAPEVLVQSMIDAARQHFDVTVETAVVAEENIVFKIPRILAT
jgi:4-hydroxy-3-methylbut-2-en-1-yl diphosphate reductase